MNIKSLQHNIFVRYIGVGGTAAIVDIGIFQGLSLQLPHWHYLLSSTISFSVATLVNYILCISFIFQAGAQYERGQEVTLIYFVSFIGLCVHHSAFYFTVEYLSIPLLLGKLMGMGTAFSWNFTSRRYWIFKT